MRPENPSSTDKNRKRRIIWFNPPYSKSISSNVGKCVLTLIEKHFPKHHKFRKLFNRNTVKVSYSCLPSMRSKINQHNCNILKTNNEETTRSERRCNCPKKRVCPMNGYCLGKDILYLYLYQTT